jgi:5-hydroxyisourate hydrolase
MSAITTHVLDTARGRPAAGMLVRLERCIEGAPPEIVGRGTTDVDGRVRNLLAPGTALVMGWYRLVFDTGTYFTDTGVVGLYPEVEVVVDVRDASQHYHIPLLLSPFGYSTYRGT